MAKGTVIMFGRLDLNRHGCQSCLSSAEQGKTFYFPCPFRVRSREFGLARPGRPSHSASARSISTPKLKMAWRMVHGAYSRALLLPFSPLSTNKMSSQYRQSPPGQFRVDQVTQLRIDGVHCRGSTGARPVVLKTVPVTGACPIRLLHGPTDMRPSFPKPTIIYNYIQLYTIIYCYIQICTNIYYYILLYILLYTIMYYYILLYTIIY